MTSQMVVLDTDALEMRAVAPPVEVVPLRPDAESLTAAREVMASLCCPLTERCCVVLGGAACAGAVGGREEEVRGARQGRPARARASSFPAACCLCGLRAGLRDGDVLAIVVCTEFGLLAVQSFLPP